MDLPMQDTSYKWTIEYVVFCVWLLYSERHVHPHCNLCQSFTPFYWWMIFHGMDPPFCLPVHPLMDISFTFKKIFRDFPGGAVVKNPPANAGDTGSSPGPGRFHMPRSNWAREPQLLSLRSRAHAPQLLSPRATTTEAHAPRARAPQQEKPPQWEARAPQQRIAPAHCN